MHPPAFFVLFQSTLPRGERPFRKPNSKPLALFQSTLPRGERRDCMEQERELRKHFNPRSHEGSDHFLKTKATDY